VLNLVFGMVARPPRERRPSLWRVRRRGGGAPKSAEAVEPAAPMSVAPEPARLPEPTKAPDSPVIPATLRQEAIVVTDEVADERHFGAKPDDFYPTEIHVDPPHDQ